MPRLRIPDRSRAAAVIAVIAIHALIGLWLSMPFPVPRLDRDERAMSVFFLNEPHDQLPGAPAAASLSSGVPVPAQQWLPDKLPPPPLRENERLASPIVHPDWWAEADRAIDNAITTAEQADRSPTSARGGADAPASKRSQAPFWDRSITHPVEQIDGTGILVRLSERCTLVITVVMMGGCKVGKIEARADLFDGMYAPAEPGDWKDR